MVIFIVHIFYKNTFNIDQVFENYDFSQCFFTNFTK